jgi:hypothetical protein
MTLDHPSEMNFVGVMLGDVNNSWRPPTGSQTIQYDHFAELESTGTAPLSQWMLPPNTNDSLPPVITSGDKAQTIDENTDAGQVVYTAKSNDYSAVYSLTEDSDAGLSIDSATGEVTLDEAPDYEAQSQYSFAMSVSLKQLP